MALPLTSFTYLGLGDFASSTKDFFTYSLLDIVVSLFYYGIAVVDGFTFFSTTGFDLVSY